MSTQRRRENEDRRVIERISSPHMRQHFTHLKRSLMFVIGFFASVSVYNLVRIESVSSYSGHLLTSLGSLFLCVFTWRLLQAVNMFLENESSSNLDRLLERQSLIWIVIAFMCVIYSLIYLVFST